MKHRMIRLTAILLLVAVVCVGLASCGVSDPFDVYWQYLDGLEDKEATSLPDQSVGVSAKAFADDVTGEKKITWQAYTSQGNAQTVRYEYVVDMVMTEVSDEYAYTLYMTPATGNGSLVVVAEGVLDAAAFNQESVLVFSKYSHSTLNEISDRDVATALMQVLVQGMNQMLDDAELSVTDFGFAAVRTDVATDTDVSVEDDLGGPFSPARWLYAGKMTLLGMGMVFVVLTVLWLVLKIFEKCLYHPKKTAEPAKAKTAPVEKVSEPVPAQSAPAVANDDGVLLAVITAAVAAAMEEEGTAVGGFRVVSFKKTTQRGGPWNG